MRIVGWDSDKIVFSDGSELTYEHKCECCEYNYADFTVLDVMLDIVEFDDWAIEFCENGFFLCLFVDGYSDLFAQKRIFIPFYSYQNGWYSNECDLVVHGKDKLRIINNLGKIRLN